MGKILKERGQYITIGVVLIIVAVALIVMMFMQGQTSFVDTNPEPVKTASTTCTSTIADYTAVKFNTQPTAKSLIVNLIFNNDIIKTVGLVYTTTYDTSDQAARAQSLMSVEFGSATGAAGFKGVGVLNEHFTARGNQTIMNLYAEKSDINSLTAPFLMINFGENDTEIISKKADYLKNYAELGFTCKDN